MGDLERKAKAFEKECESRQEAAMQAALNRATGEQKELLIKILAKMTGNMSVFAFKIWAEKVQAQRVDDADDQNLVPHDQHEEVAGLQEVVRGLHGRRAGQVQAQGGAPDGAKRSVVGCSTGSRGAA